MKKIIVPVLGLFFALTARADGPALEERLQKIEADLASVKQQLAIKTPVQGDVVVSYGSWPVKGGKCGALETISMKTGEAQAAKVLKVLDCTKTEGATSYFKAKFFLVQFGNGSIGLFHENYITPL